MRLLLTGGTGFIGTPVRTVLGQHDFDFFFTTSRDILDHGAAGTPIRCDLLSEQGRILAVETAKADTLIHLAWYAEPGNFWQSSRNLDWVTASLDLVQRFTRAGGKRCLVIGTCAEYSWLEGGCFSESHTPLRPATFYGIAKDALRRVLQGYADVTGLSLLWCRLFWPYGPGEPQGRLFSSLISALQDNKTAICRSGNLKRDYMHVDDIAEVIMAAAFSQMEGTMNIGSGESIALGDLAAMLAKLIGKSELLQIEKVKTGPGNPETIYANTKRMNNMCHIKRKSLKDGIRTLL